MEYAPISAPPCTPEWPRIGMSPQRSRPTKPRVSPRFRIICTRRRRTCWVMPMLQTSTAVFARRDELGELCMLARGRPLSFSKAAQSQRDVLL